MSDMLNPKDILLSSVALPEPKVHKGHPFVNEKAHKALADFVLPRMDLAAAARDSRIPRYAATDKQIYGWLRQSQQDKERQQKKDETGAPIAVEQHVPLGLTHLNDAVSFYSGVFAPTRGMFYHLGDAEEQVKGQKMLKVMNQQAQHAGYYKELMRAVLDIHKYHLGGLIIDWDVEVGNEVSREAGQKTVTPTVVWEGNRLTAVDPYNAFWPAGIDPIMINTQAEFFGTARRVSYFEMQKKSANSKWFNTERLLKDVNRKDVDKRTSGRSYFKSVVSELNLDSDSQTQDSPGSWLDGQPAQASSVQGIYELLTVYIWLNPYQHDLVEQTPANKVKRNRLELWELEYVDGQYLVSAKHVTNAHARIPVAMGTLGNDSLGVHQKSPAEILRPMQDFLSFLLNTHIAGVRKNIWGLTIYDKQVVDLSTIPDGEVAARVPATPTGADKDLSKAIHEHKGTIDTKQAMGDFQSMLGIVNQMFPTQPNPSEIAGIDRAVDRQVAAVIQGGSRPLQMSARLIDETLLRQARMLMFFNIVEYLPETELFEPDDSKTPETISGEGLQDVKLEYLIGQGLKALDKQTVSAELQRLVFAVLQSTAAAEIDVLGLMNTWADFMDIDIDMTQFRREAPQPEEVLPQGVVES